MNRVSRGEGSRRVGKEPGQLAHKTPCVCYEGPVPLSQNLVGRAGAARQALHPFLQQASAHRTSCRSTGSGHGGDRSQINRPRGNVPMPEDPASLKAQIEESGCCTLHVTSSAVLWCNVTLLPLSLPASSHVQCRLLDPQMLDMNDATVQIEEGAGPANHPHASGHSGCFRNGHLIPVVPLG